MQCPKMQENQGFQGADSCAKNFFSASASGRCREMQENQGFAGACTIWYARCAFDMQKFMHTRIFMHSRAQYRRLSWVKVLQESSAGQAKTSGRKAGKPSIFGAAYCGSGARAAANPGAVGIMAALVALAVLAVCDLLRRSWLCRLRRLCGSAADIRRNVWALAAALSECSVWAALAV